MGNPKQLKRICCGIFLVGLIITGTFFASESYLSIHKRRSFEEQTDNVTMNMTAKKGKLSSTVNSSIVASNPININGSSVPPSLYNNVNDTNYGDNTANSSFTTSTATRLNFTTPSSNIVLSSASIALTALSNASTSYASTSSPKSAQGASPIPTTTVTSPATTPAASETTKASYSTSQSPTSSLKENITTVTQASTSRDQQPNQTSSTVSFNNSHATNGTLHEKMPGEGGLTPVLAAVVGLSCGLVFFVMIYAIFKLVKNFRTFRFRRLHDMPMDDFDDYSGVYVEHTVPIRG